MLHACKGHLKHYEQQHKELHTTKKSTKIFKLKNKLNV